MVKRTRAGWLVSNEERESTPGLVYHEKSAIISLGENRAAHHLPTISERPGSNVPQPPFLSLSLPPVTAGSSPCRIPKEYKSVIGNIS